MGAFYIVRLQGIEPWSRPWQGRILPLNHNRILYKKRTPVYAHT